MTHLERKLEVLCCRTGCTEPPLSMASNGGVLW